ncbi:hypothetical protein GCM10029963_24010 [Micromonospora andamanensis]
MRLGIDLVALDELDRLLRRGWFLRYFFAAEELAQAEALGDSRRREYLVGRFAAKEAVLKVLGTGLFEGSPPGHRVAAYARRVAKRHVAGQCRSGSAVGLDHPRDRLRHPQAGPGRRGRRWMVTPVRDQHRNPAVPSLRSTH